MNDYNIGVGYIAGQMTNKDIPYTPPEDPLPTEEELYRRLLELADGVLTFLGYPREIITLHFDT